MIEMIERTTKMIDQGKEKIERQIEEALLLSQFIINNTIAVQEWFLNERNKEIKSSTWIYKKIFHGLKFRIDPSHIRSWYNVIPITSKIANIENNQSGVIVARRYLHLLNPSFEKRIMVILSRSPQQQ